MHPKAPQPPRLPPSLPKRAGKRFQENLSKTLLPPLSAPEENALTEQELHLAQQAQAILNSRQREAARHYEPLPDQLKFHRSLAPTRLIGGSNQCLAGDQTIYDPVTGLELPVSEISSPFHVLSFNERTESFEVKPASRPFIKGHGRLYEYRSLDGRTLRCTSEHLVLSAGKNWVSMEQVWFGFGYGSIPLFFAGENREAFTSFTRIADDGEIWDFEVEDNHNYVAGGVINHNSGKSQAAAAEAAWILTGEHPFDKGYPKENGLFYAVGYDEKHIQNLMWPKLSREGAILLIRDEITKEWRNFRPWEPYDDAYREKTIPAEPFLPRRLIRDFSWHSKKDDVPAIVRMKNGWELHFFTSKGYPQKGTQIHAWWMDEELEKDGWHAELLARSMMHRGKGFWSATPEISTPQFFRLYQKAAKQKPGDVKTIDKFWLLLDQNPYISDEKKAEFKAGLPDRLVAVKYYGNFAISGMLVYPEFSPQIHVVPSVALPPSFARYMVVDPGVSVCGVLFAAVPPDDRCVHVYKELYIRRCSASIFASEVAGAMGEYRRAFEAFLIDNQAGRQTQIGSGKTIVEHYAEELDKVGVFSRTTGCQFLPGNPDIRGREESLRSWFEINPKTGFPSVRIHENCVMLLWEMDQQFYDRKKGEVTDKKRLDKDNHLVDCLEYLASYDPAYHRPPALDERDTPIETYLREKLRKQNRSQEDCISLGPARFL